MSVIFGIGAFQAFVFSILLYTKRDKKEADDFLSGFFFIIMLYFLYVLSYTYGVWRYFPDIIFIMTIIPLSYGPLLYFYVRSLIKGRASRKLIAIHILPIIVTYLIILPFAFHSKEEKLLYFTDKFINLPINISIGIFIQYLSAPVYFILIIRLIRKHRTIIKNNYSSIEKINLTWMHKLVTGVISLLMVDIIYVYLINFTDITPIFFVSWTIKSAFLLFTVFVGYYGLMQGSIFGLNYNKLDKKEQRAKEVSLKNVPDEIANQKIEILEKYMENEKAFLNNELRIQDVSVDLSIPVHILSHIINVKLSQNFYDFVNAYRINEAKSRLHNPNYDNFTVLAIAFDCGFNSKTTFNRLFKQNTGLTPTQYKKLRA